MLINWSDGDKKSWSTWLRAQKYANVRFVHPRHIPPICAWTIKKTEMTANIIVVYRGKTNMIAMLLIMKAKKYALILIPTDVPCLIAEELMCVQTVCQHHIKNRIVLVYVWKRTSLQVY